MIDVVVIGAGPAGSLAARECARAGLSVCLVDKARFPRTKVCGATLNGHALETLRRADLGGLPHAVGAVPLKEFHLEHRKRSLVVPLEHHHAISRSALDLALLQAAGAAGVDVRTETIARVGVSTTHDVAVELSRAGGAELIHAGVVIAADGLGSRILGQPRVAESSRIGAATQIDPHHGFPRGRLTMAVGRTGYVGIVVLEDGRLDVAAALDREAAKSGVATCVESILAEAGVPRSPALGTAAFTAVPALTRTPRSVAVDRVFAVGDAAGYVEPFTGEGIGWALESGLLVAPFVEARLRGNDSAAEHYRTAYSRSIRRRQRLCRAIAWTLRHELPLSLAMSALTRFSSLGRGVLSHLDAEPRGVGI